MNIYYTRNRDRLLAQWVERKQRNVLLLRGARQVGKSRSVQELGKRFAHYLEINFEQEPAVASIFSASRDPQRICQQLSAYYDIPIIPTKTLLFIDEIQACKQALLSLRFFKEKMPQLHVIAAGSLLEFALGDLSSFGVGRVTSVFFYPFSFGEFLSATFGDNLRHLARYANLNHPLDDANMGKLTDALRIYLAIGGLPGVVSLWIATQDFRRCQEQLESIATAYQADFPKYKSRISTELLRDTLRSVTLQAGNKFVYSKVGIESSGKYYKLALETLQQAGLVYKVHHTSAAGIPLRANKNPRKFKAIVFDVGLHQRMMGLDLRAHILYSGTELINKGSVAEAFVGTELASMSSPYSSAELFYWHREARSSNAEVDYIIEHHGQVIPLEVKAKTRGAMKSLHRFIGEKHPPYGLRCSLENFTEYNGIRTLPLVALEQLTMTE